MRKGTVGTLFAILLCAALQAADRPNVIVILADDLGYSDLSCYGGEILTPNLDRLAAGGSRFSSFYTSARCCPSRAALITGLHPHQAGIGSFAEARPVEGRGPAYTGHLLPNCVTLAEALADAGYSTWMVGKWHMGIPGPMERGFQNYFGFRNFLAYAEDQWDPEKYVRLPAGTQPEIEIDGGSFYATDIFSEYALEFLHQARRKEQPFFLYLAHSSPHFPVQAPKETIDRYVDIYRKGWDALRSERLARQKELGLFNPDFPLPPRSMVPIDREDIANGYPGEPNPAWDSLPEDRREDLARRMATFAAMVEHVDTGIGRLIMDLEEHGDLDQTLILFMSDNGACYEWGPFGFDGPSRQGLTILHTGEELAGMGQPGTHHSYGSGWANLGNTPLNMYKHFCHEGGLSSPLIVHWPAGLSKAGGWVREPSHLMDIFPTVLEAAGAEYPMERQGFAVQPLEGISLLPAIEGENIPERSLAFEHQAARGLRRGVWKITWGKREPTPIEWRLYNLDDDRSEQHDLSAEHPGLKAELIGEWEAWAKRVGAEPFFLPDNPELSGFVEEGREDPPAANRPTIAKQPFTVIAEVTGQNLGGVVLAQGGREQGFAIHLIHGVPAFDVRINGRVTRLSASEPVEGAIRIEARLDEERMSLLVNDGPAVSMPSPGLIPVQPKDELSVGLDTLTAAGEYDPPNPFNGTIVNTRVETGGGDSPTTKSVMDRETIEKGLKAHERALFVKSGWIRDPYIVNGPDGWFYLTGTTPDEGDPREQTDPYNTGLGKESIVGWSARVWRSRDLIDWESLGAPFTLKEGIWWQERRERFSEVPVQFWRLWAPELHWLGNRWALVHTSPSPVAGANLSLTSGDDLEGPWQNPMGADIGRRHDPSLFQDDDGTWWLIWGATSIQALSPDFSSFRGNSYRIGPSGQQDRMGHEGCLIRKIDGTYVLFGTGWSTNMGRRGSYNLYYATADRLTGPYSQRKFVGRFLGHGTPFQDHDGRWWCTAFFNANVPPLDPEGIIGRNLEDTAQTINEQGLTIVPLTVSRLDNGELFIRAKDPAYASPGPDEAQQFQLSEQE